MEKKNKVTKAQKFEDIISILRGEMPKHGSTVELAIEAMENELTLLANKKNSANSKPTQRQEENASFKTMILNELAVTDNEHGMTCTELAGAIPALNRVSNQRIAQIMRQLNEEHEVFRHKVKETTYFRLPEEGDVWEK